MTNLLANAVQYSLDGVFITLKTWTQDGHAQLSVTDSDRGSTFTVRLPAA